MPEYLHIPPVAQAVLTITGVVLAVVRLLTASKAFWWRFPEWLQKGLPAALVALGTLPKALEMAQSWMDVVVAFAFAVGAWFTASRGDQRPVEPPKSKEPPSDSDVTVSLMPPPASLRAPDRSRLHNDVPDEPAECRGLALALLCCLVVGCAGAKLPCDDAKLRAIDADYLKEVAKRCLQYSSAAGCPELPELRAKHSRDLKASCP